MSLGEVAKQTEQPKKFQSMFKPINQVEEGEGIKCLVFGPPETGKTFFSLSCPGPLYIISTEFGVKKVSHHFSEKMAKNEINLIECNVPFGEGLKNKKGDEDYVPGRVDPIASIQKVYEAADNIYEGLQAGEIKPGGTIVLDSISDVWNWLAILIDYKGEKAVSKTGQEYTKGNEWQKVNEAFRTLVNKFNILPFHVVLTARLKEVRDKEGKKSAPDTYKAAKDTAHFVDLVLHTQKKADVDAAKQGKVVMKRLARIEKSRYQSMNDLEIEDVTFEKLKSHFAKLGLGHLFEIKS